MSTYRFSVILTLAFAMTIIAITEISGQSDFQYELPLKRQESSTAHKYCGKHLSSALQLLCNGVYNSMFKKSGQEMEMDDYPYPYEYLMRPRQRANAMVGLGGRFRRQSRGVHDECCVKPCSISELRSYCGN